MLVDSHNIIIMYRREVIYINTKNLNRLKWCKIFIMPKPLCKVDFTLLVLVTKVDL